MLRIAEAIRPLPAKERGEVEITARWKSLSPFGIVTIGGLALSRGQLRKPALAGALGIDGGTVRR
jgi:hypothetical protein